MAGETDQTLYVVGEPTVGKNKSAFGVNSDIPAAPSSSNMADVKKSTITKDDCLAYHATGWLGGGLESLVPKVDIPTVDGSTMVCFESQLVAGLGLPPSKFLVAIMNFLGCELVHLNPNTIATLSCFTMLCECWIGIAPDTSLFWYFYSHA
jgi:hypothetical protein